ncbi:MAG: hypothetical protein HQK83_03330 [Fibrobacteria bacterium]|nr:hypothetical protein [Fibrobacteria bacterium]
MNTHRYLSICTIVALLISVALVYGEKTVADDGSSLINTSMAKMPSEESFTRDFYFSNLDIRSAFKALAKSGNVDIVLSPTVSGKVSLSLSDKTWEQALRILCLMHNLHSSVETGYVYVQTMAEVNSIAKEEQLEREIIKLKHSKVKDLEEAVKGLLSSRGKISLLESSNALIVTDLRTRMDAIQKAINTLDVERFQVHIQAEIIEVNSNDLQEMGFNWGNVSNKGIGTINQSGNIGSAQIPTSNTGTASATSSSQSAVTQLTPSKYSEFYNVASTGGKVANPSLSMAFGLLKGRLMGVVEYLLSEGKGEVVAKPQITTMDNKEARIFIGENIPFLKQDESFNSIVEYVSAGIELIVTPHITNENRIILDLQPQRSSASTDPISKSPRISTTEARTTVVVNDGQTVVIGGLTSKSQNEIESGIPLLKDIPLLGFLFRYTKKEVVKKDLIIFITPYIVRNDLEMSAIVKSPGKVVEKKPTKTAIPEKSSSRPNTKPETESFDTDFQTDLPEEDVETTDDDFNNENVDDFLNDLN